MHPAKSVIFFTTASGAGYGLLILFALADLAGLMPRGIGFTLWVFGTGFGLVTAGLLSSTLHLGHPERAWRAFSQWRSSWLSREGVAAVLSYPPLGLYGLLRLLDHDRVQAGTPEILAALAGIAIALVTVYCTAMIYASLKPVRAWASPWTPACYLLLSVASGAVLLNVLAGFHGVDRLLLALPGILLLAAGLAGKLGYWRRQNSGEFTSSAESATGIGNGGKVRLLEAPHSEENYLMREMGFSIARKHGAKLRRIAVIWGFVLPAASLLACAFTTPIAGNILLLIALITATVGIACERWLFFAEAKHAVSLYYGASTA